MKRGVVERDQMNLIPGCFDELIRKAHAATGERVVVLVDEYDKPILDNLTAPDTARAMRDGLRNLYSVIKDADAHIRFAFLTGVSKFSKVSLFSGLNNLRDITLASAYSAICGYTEVDVDGVFAPELAGLDRELIRVWYNGYNWTGEAVYNPFDLLLLFQERQYRPFWFETATPTFFSAFFASIPSDWYRNNPIARYEGYYASVFYAYFAALGLDITLEDSSNQGRLDMAVRFNGHRYLFEFKVVELVSSGEALEQIKERGYADQYRAEGLPIHLIGVEFSRDRRSVVGFEVEHSEPLSQ